MKRSLWGYLCLCGVLFASLASQANTLEVSVRVDRNPVIVNESFNLIVTANEDLPRWAFSSQPLMQDFVVGSTSINTSTQIINGQASQTTSWTVRLTARRPGAYTIPPFSIEGYTTQAIDLEVIEANQSGDGEQRPFFLQATVSNQSAYVQQQLIYKVELYLQANIPLEGGSMTAPEGEHIAIEQITQNRERQEIVNGTRYRVITQEYAITPQRSGELSNVGARFDGVYRGASTRSLTGFARPEQVTLYADDISLSIQPRPQNFPGPWLVSENVTIEEDWDPDSVVLQVGEPITRTLVITAEGVRPEQLPEPNPVWPEELRIYPERPQHESFVAQGTRITQSRISTVIIPAKVGTYTLPATEIAWFNAKTQQIEYARVPARELSVINPPGGVASPRAAALSDFTDEAQSTEEQVQTEANEFPTSDTVTVQDSRLLIIISTLWLITSAILISWVQYYRKRSMSRENHRATSANNGNKVPEHARASLNALKQHCAKNDAKNAAQALLAWQQARTGRPATLRQLRSAFASNASFIDALDQLERSLYSADQPIWTGGKALWQAIQSLHRGKGDNNSEPPVSLYPE